MKLLAFNAYYTPEVVSSIYLTTDLYKDFAKAGINVKLYVPLPTRGVSDEVRNRYKGKKEKHQNGRFKIIWVDIPREKENLVKRALRYVWMNIVFIKRSFKCRADGIFVYSTPPTQGVMAAIIKKIKKIPFIFSLQDVFPDSMVSAGITDDKSAIYKLGRIIENFTYKNADLIIVISNDIKNNLLKKGVSGNKIIVIPNWIDSKTVHPVEKDENYLYEKYNISKNKFNVVYAGNLGYMQNIEVIIKAAECLKNNKDIQFIIFGKGAQEREYKEMANGLDNIHFFPIQPYSEVSYVYSLGDVSIVPCKKGVGSTAMPSKTWSIMATGTPVLASFDRGTELEHIVKDEETGLFNDAEDAEGLASNIIKLYKDEKLKYVLGMNAKNYVENNLKREVCTKKYIDAIRKVFQCQK